MKTTAATPRPAEIRHAALRRFWQRMVSIYGHKWASAHGVSCDEFDASGQPTGRLTIDGDTWLRGLAGAGESRVALGLEACLLNRADEWPPSLPEFRALCFGVPTMAKVRAQIRAKELTPFVRQVWNYLDVYRFHRATQDQADRMLEDAYELTKAHVMAGGELPQDPVAELTVQPEKRTPAMEQTERESIAAIEAALGIERDINIEDISP